MDKQNEKKSTGAVLLILIAIVVACMIFPTGIFYSAGSSDVAYTGLGTAFGGDLIKVTHTETKLNLVAVFGYFLPILGTIIYTIFARKTKIVALFPALFFLASFILLFCTKGAFLSVNGLIDASHYTLGVGPILGGSFGVIGFLVSLIFGIKQFFK